MLNAFETAITSAYKEVFGDLEEPDQKRKEALESVVKDRILLGTMEITIDESIDTLKVMHGNAKEGELQADIKQKIKDHELLRTLREWYETSEKEPLQDAKARVVQNMPGTDMPYIQDNLEECMLVLYKHRITSLTEPFYTSLGIRKGLTRDDKIIRKEAEKLLKIKNSEITDIVVANMEVYHLQLKSTLNNALEEGDDKTITSAAQILYDSGVPSLREYVDEKFATYKREIKDKVITGKDKTKEVKSTIRYEIEDGRVISYTGEKTSIKKWAIGIGIAAVIATAAYLAIPSKEPAQQPNNIIQK
jgi:hypothetical protein